MPRFALLVAIAFLAMLPWGSLDSDPRSSLLLPAPLRALASEPTPMPESYGLVGVWDTVRPTGRMLFHPMGIAVDRGGTVVLTEIGNHRITVASSRGLKPRSLQPGLPPEHIGRQGADSGEFAAPEDIAVSADGRTIYVADTGNGRVQVLAPNGTVLSVWDDVGNPRGIALGPGPVADGAAPDARVYVADAQGRRVRVYAADGTWLDDWTGGDELITPLGLSITPAGHLAVADHGAQRIVWLLTEPGSADQPAGTIVGTLRLDNFDGPGGAPLDVGVNGDGEVYVAVDRGVLRFRSVPVTDLGAMESEASSSERELVPIPSSARGLGDTPSSTREIVAVQEQSAAGTGVAAGLRYASVLPALRHEPCGGTCPAIGPPCSSVVTELDSHEGVQRLDLRPGVGLFVTYAPSMRWLDRVVVYPAHRPSGKIAAPSDDVGWAWPQPCRDFPTAEFRHATDPERIAAGKEEYAVALDSPGWLRLWNSDGSWRHRLLNMEAQRGQDIAVNPMGGGRVAVLSGNHVNIFILPCMVRRQGQPRDEPCRLTLDVLDRTQLMRRERTNECRMALAIPWRDGWAPCIPDDRWWHVATAIGPLVGALDAGRQRLVMRSGPALAGGVNLSAARDPFRSFSDLTYDTTGRLWVLARDGAVRVFDDNGRDRGEMKLEGPAQGRASSLAVAPDGSFFVLTGDGYVNKYAPALAPAPTATEQPRVTPGPSPRPTRTLSRPTATPRPTMSSHALPLARWKVADLAGDGRYRDLAVGSDGRVLVTDGQNDRVVVFAPATPAPSATLRPPEREGCRFETVKTASPSRLDLGGTTTVSLELTGDCGARHQALDVAVVLDASCQMSGVRLARTREALGALVDAMTLPQDRLAFVTFLEGQGDARLTVPLTDDRDVLHEAAAAFRTECRIVDTCMELSFRNLGHIRSYLWPSGCLTEGRISDGLRAGREALSGPAARPEAGKVLLLLSPSLFDSVHILATLSLDTDTFDPPFNAAEMDRWRQDLSWAGDIFAEVTDREHATWEAWRLREADIRVLTSGVGTDSFGAGHPPDEGLLAAIAWPADGYRPAGTPEDLSAIFAANGRELSARFLMHSLVITDIVPANMRLVPGSISPAAQVLPDGPNGEDVLTWTFSDIPLSGPPMLSYRLEPLEPGLWPTNIEAWATYVDGLGATGRNIFPVPRVDVAGPTPTDEPTPAEPVATATATPTNGASPTPPPSATPAPDSTDMPPRQTPPATATTPRPVSVDASIYLPVSLTTRCGPRRPLDVALLIDISTSMEGEKLAAARHAAITFAGLLDLRQSRDRAAIVSFDNEARVVQPLTSVQSALVAALESLTAAPGTRIDRGLMVAMAELGGQRYRANADRALVMLTDGRPHPGTEAAAIAAADAARAAGISVWAIGLGDDADPALLARIAGSAAQVLLAPRAADLETAFRRVAGDIICR